MNCARFPELCRNLWLRFSPLKIMAVPLVLLLCTVITLNMSGGHPLEGLQRMSTIMFVLFVFVFGNHEAGTAVQEEFKGRTWDQQKMSAITPGQLAFGKLAGATSYAWYIGFSALGILYYTSGRLQMDAGYSILSLVMAGALGHAVGFLFSLADLASAARRNIRNHIPGAKGPFLLGLFASYCVTSFLDIPLTGAVAHKSASAILDIFRWHDAEFDVRTFKMASVFLFYGWSLVGIYRQTRAELMYRTAPLAWIAFVFTVAIYLAGFPDTSHQEFRYSFIFCCMFFVFLGFTYFTMLSEAPDTRKYERLGRALRRRDWRGAFINTPKWLATLPFMMMLYVAIFATKIWIGETDKLVDIYMLLTSGLLFAVRDGLVNHAILADRADGKSAGFQRILYYLLVYALLPALHGSAIINLPEFGDVFDFTHKARAAADSIKVHAWSWYAPSSFSSPIDALLPVTIQVLLAGCWLYARLKKMKKEGLPR